MIPGLSLLASAEVSVSLQILLARVKCLHPLLLLLLAWLQAVKPFARSAEDNVEWDSSMRERVR